MRAAVGKSPRSRFDAGATAIRNQASQNAPIASQVASTQVRQVVRDCETAEKAWNGLHCTQLGRCCGYLP